MSFISIYQMPREKALKILRNRAEVEAQSSEMENIHIKAERFYEAFVKSYDETVEELKRDGYL